MDREELIEKYVQGRLTETEQVEFNWLLKSEDDFKEYVEFHQKLKKVTEAEDDAHFRKLLAEFEEEAIGQQSKVGTLPAKWLVAASIALLLTLGYIFVFNQTQSTQELFNEYFQPYPNVTHPIVRNSGEASTKNDAFSAYDNEDYEKASTTFSELYSETGESYYLFYKANALIQLNRAKEAIPVLKEHLNFDDKLNDKTHWYLAMAYLQIDDTENAKIMLQKVVDGNELNAKTAKKLLKSLK